MTKLEILKNDIKKLENLAVAFSGGVDSSLLLKVAADVLGENALALTVKSPYMSLREIDEAVEFAKFYGIRHEIFEVGKIAVIFAKKQFFQGLSRVQTS